MGCKRTKKDVCDAYHRGFHDGYLAAPSPLFLFIQTLIRKRKLKKLKAAWTKVVEESTGKPPRWIDPKV